ncbi:MAG: hypothetical protein VX768_14810 [Planctomycetota bacterium]|nr:hypothetical protein [Planctomycetota bacterium]
MSIRSTINLVSAQARYYSQVRQNNLAFLQFQASSGLKHQRLSDDPIASERLFSLKRTVNSLDANKAVMDEVESTLNLSVSNLTEAHQIVRNLQQISIQARQADDAELPILASQVDDLLGRLVNLANATENDRYQYGGQNDKTTPYVRNPEGDYPPYLYQGGNEALEVTISENIRMDIYRPGQEIFGSLARGETVFVGETGAKPGAGTDSAKIQGSLQVVHSLTSYPGGSGVAAGTDSVNGDTIIGALGTHQLNLIDTSGTGASGTVQLNGGPEFNWSSADDNLKIEGPKGEVVFLDTQGIAAGFSGAVDLVADGTLSVDGGVSTVPIDFSNNQLLTDTQTDDVTNVDSSEIVRVGSELIEYTGTSDLFSTITELKNDLLNSRGLVGKQWDQSLLRRGQDLEGHANAIIETVGEQSVSLESLVGLRERNRAYSLEVTQVIDDVEGADLTEVVLQLQEEQNLLQYTFAVTSSILSQNLLDYLK